MQNNKVQKLSSIEIAQITSDSLSDLLAISLLTNKYVRNLTCNYTNPTVSTLLLITVLCISILYICMCICM